MGDEKTVATLAKQIAELSENIKPVIEFVDTAKTWRNDLDDLQKRVKEMGEKGLDPTKDENLKNYLKSIMDRQDEEARRNKLLNSNQEQYVQLPDCWKGSYSDFLAEDFTDHGELIRTKGLKGLDIICQTVPINDQHKALTHLATDVKIADAVMRAQAVVKGQTYPGFAKALPKLHKRWQTHLKAYIKAVAPMDTTDQADWVPTGWSSEFRELIVMQLKVAALFQRIPMPQSPYELPIDMTDDVGEHVAESTTTTNPYADTGGQVLVADKHTLTAKKGRARLITSGELNEESIYAILPLMRMKLVKILAKSQERAVVNGQKTSTIDTGDAPTGTDIRLWFDGLRWHAKAKSVEVSLSTFDKTTVIRNMRAKMTPAFSADVSALVYIASMDAYLTALMLDQVLTLEKYGPAAVILTGELAKLGGVPMVVTGEMRKDLNTAGIYDGSTVDNTAMLLVHVGSYLFGDRRDITIEAERWINSDQFNVVAFQRMDFINLFTTSQLDMAYGVDITSL